MIPSEFKHLSKEQLKKRIKMLRVFCYVSAAIGISSFFVFFFTHYKLNWSWLLIGLTYILLSVNFMGTIRRMRKEIHFREDRRKKKEAAQTL